MSKRTRQKRVLIAALVLILVMVTIYSGLRILESTVLYTTPEQTEVPRKTIQREGVEYFPRQDITVILVMGIDQEGKVVSSGSYRNNGEVDVVSLVVLDQREECYRVLSLNRDTMVTMPALGLGGKQAGTFYGQLALSHTYGSGLADSAENTRQTVSELLYGLRIDHYVAVNMDAIGIVNDAVGGVTVNVTDDFSQVDPTITKGTMTLHGDQAMTFVRTRKDVGTQMNLSRMERQKEYMAGLSQALTEKVTASESFAVELYDALAEYMVTDCSVNVISGLIQRCGEYPLAENLTLPGENVLGEEYYEFYVNPEETDELILRLFYEPKE